MKNYLITLTEDEASSMLWLLEGNSHFVELAKKLKNDMESQDDYEEGIE